jgi:hypothetical protein
VADATEPTTSPVAGDVMRQRWPLEDGRNFPLTIRSTFAILDGTEFMRKFRQAACRP